MAKEIVAGSLEDTTRTKVSNKKVEEGLGKSRKLNNVKLSKSVQHQLSLTPPTGFQMQGRHQLC